MRKQYGTQEQAQARDLRPLCQLHLPGQRPLRLRQPPPSTTSISPWRATPPRTRDARRLLAGIGKSPRDYAPVAGNARLAAAPQPDPGPDGAATATSPTSWPGAARPSRSASSASPWRRPRHPRRSSTCFDELQAARRRALQRSRTSSRAGSRVHSTVDRRVQTVVNEALENGLARYEKRHPRARGLIQGSVVVLANADGAILAEAGGRQHYRTFVPAATPTTTASPARCGSPDRVMKPLVYLAAFRSGLTLDATVPRRSPSACQMAPRATGSSGSPTTTPRSRVRSPLAPGARRVQERAVAVWIAETIGTRRS